ncbi:hypothetical protein L207DRAFT_516223 [Hyaloscypha variabilis F]|uniref:Uncharacterized protein n=1 Tax=Hyaloscypha variabilis (strain UAMH 11265 / GT02V1 / F) TaxID=1149755 RepID=A0A2J6R9T6_HYAVF|nr:hypothetical protein L207DRAFT_516223 [Hyaloscypha variabilis F]
MDQGTSAVENVMLCSPTCALRDLGHGVEPSPDPVQVLGTVLLFGASCCTPTSSKPGIEHSIHPRLLLAFYITYQLIGSVAAEYREQFSGECLGIQEKQQRPSVLTAFRRLRKPEATGNALRGTGPCGSCRDCPAAPIRAGVKDAPASIEFPDAHRSYRGYRGA